MNFIVINDGFAKMLKGGVIMDVSSVEEAKIAEEEAELDKVLDESIESVKAGNELIPPVEAPEEPGTPPTGPTGPGETGPAPAPAGETGPGPGETGPGETGPGETGPGETGPAEYEFRVPNKGKFESDESFEKRIELLDLVKRKKLAKTDEQREALSEDIMTAKSQMKTLNGTDRFVNPLNQKEEGKTKPDKELTEGEKALEADKERLKELGGATKEDIQEMVQAERLAGDVKSTLDKFVDRHTELKDEDTREVFFDFVDANYNWKNKGGKELMTVLELARENMFKPSESIQERVLKGANVQEKVNAMQFPVGTIAKTEYSPEKQKSIDEIVATGMSEEKAVELLSD